MLVCLLIGETLDFEFRSVSSSDPAALEFQSLRSSVLYQRDVSEVFDTVALWLSVVTSVQ